MTIKGKMTLWYTLLMVVIMALVLSIMLYMSDRVTESRAETLLSSVVEKNAANVWFSNGQLIRLGFAPYDDGVNLQIYDADGSLLAGYSPLDTMPENLEDGLFQTVTANGETVYLYSMQVLDYGIPLLNRIAGTASGEMITASGEMGGPLGSVDPARSAWVCGILPTDTFDDILSSVIKLAFIAFPIMLLLAVLGGWFIASRSLAPVRKLTEAARDISDGEDLSRRIELGPGKDEIHTLAHTFNDMFARLERSFTAERQFTSDASHELRTPTAIILAECGSAREAGDDPAELQESLAVIDRQAQKMSALISRLMMFAQLDQGRQKTERARVDLSLLAEAICEEQALIEERDITIETDIQPDVCVTGDEQLLLILIQNLITNARKYGKPNGHIHVGLHPRDGQAVFAVRDDGIGISETQLPRIWDRFYQADSARTNGDGSAGLGLSLAKEIVRLHGGTIAAESVLGEGSTFTFTLPLMGK